MKKIVLSSSLLLLSFNLWATKLSDLKPFHYEVVFTNPICKAYEYESPVVTNAGEYVYAKPENVYCKKADVEFNGKRKDTPRAKILEIINDPKTKELFLTYLSFSEKEVAENLCQAIEQRDVKVTFIIDSKNEERGEGMEQLNRLKQCRSKTAENAPVLLTRGNKGGIGFAHNKVIIQNPHDENQMKIVFSSGNMSSGTLLHHENWHFVLVSAKSYFAQSHLCLMNGMLSHHEKASEFKSFMKECRNSIKFEEESDIKMYAVPGDGKEALDDIAIKGQKSDAIAVAAHRFSCPEIDDVLKLAMSENKSVRLVADDDIYWTGILKKQVGANTINEFFNVLALVREGMEVKYMQTNQDSKYLHHNKFLVFDNAVFTGAGNLTKSAFEKNFENFYMINIPEVVDAFKVQYEKMWKELATSYEQMPKEYKMP